MTWEETIKYIRTQPAFKDLVKFAYFEEDLKLNVERFKINGEFIETKKLINGYTPLRSDTKLLDIGSGNGISAVAFALDGVQVEAVEPDSSNTIGAGAIRKLKEIYNLSNLIVHEGFAEDLQFPDNKFDIVYIRQCMHHANDLQQFLNECARVLKKNGLLVTVRDHVIFNEEDKAWFLENHPLQKFYGGENAYTPTEYKTGMTKAGFTVMKELKYFDSEINYFPISKQEKVKKGVDYDHFVDGILKSKLGIFRNIGFIKKLAIHHIEKKLIHPYDESQIPGRMYSYIAQKK